MRKMKAGVQTAILTSLTVKGNSEKRVSQCFCKNEGKIKKTFLFSFDKWGIFVDQGKDPV